MTMEPGAQNQPVEAPVVASTPAAALKIQILATEHWSLLATRSQTWNESFARTRTRTWPWPASGCPTSRSSSTSGGPNLSWTIACIACSRRSMGPTPDAPGGLY